MDQAAGRSAPPPFLTRFASRSDTRDLGAVQLEFFLFRMTLLPQVADEHEALQAQDELVELAET